MRGARRQADLPASVITSAAPALLLRERPRDPHQSGVDMGDLVLQGFDGEMRLQRADHRSASGALQHGDGALLAERRDEAAFKGMSTAFCTGRDGHVRAPKTKLRQGNKTDRSLNPPEKLARRPGFAGRQRCYAASFAFRSLIASSTS